MTNCWPHEKWSDKESVSVDVWKCNGQQSQLTAKERREAARAATAKKDIMIDAPYLKV